VQVDLFSYPSVILAHPFQFCRLAISTATVSHMCVLILYTILCHVAYPSTMQMEAAGSADTYQTA